MSELRSAIDSLRAETLADLPDARIEEDFAELHRACEALEGERLRRLAELDRRRTFERDGHLSAASWLASAFSMAWGTAPEAVRVARALEDMPKTRRALEGGRSPPPPCGCWPRPRRPTPMRSAGASESWWTRPGSTPSGSCSGWRGTGARRWSSSTGGRHEDTLFEWRRLHASPTIFGMVRVDGDLDPETGETLLSALRAIMDAEARSPDPTDHRTPAQRRADALAEVCRQWLDLADRPNVGGERPHVTVSVDVEAWGDGHSGPAELDHIGPIKPELARRVACDASIMRVVMAGGSEPLDVGRRTPVISPAMRRAVIARDPSCRFPGCDRPHTWCDGHHIVHWADGGPTALPNPLLLCRRHHRMVHHPGGFRLELTNGRPVFRRPDGSVLEDRAPP